MYMRGDWGTKIPSRRKATAPQRIAPSVTFSKKKKPKYSQDALRRRLGGR